MAKLNQIKFIFEALVGFIQPVYRVVLYSMGMCLFVPIATVTLNSCTNVPVYNNEEAVVDSSTEIDYPNSNKNIEVVSTESEISETNKKPKHNEKLFGSILIKSIPKSLPQPSHDIHKGSSQLNDETILSDIQDTHNQNVLTKIQDDESTSHTDSNSSKHSNHSSPEVPATGSNKSPPNTTDSVEQSDTGTNKTLPEYWYLDWETETEEPN